MNKPLPRSAAPAVAQQPSNVEVFVGEVLPPSRLEAITGALPAHVKPERFQRNLFIALTAQPKLMNCHPVAVFNEVSKAAALGLYLDPQLGEGYLIAAWDSRQSREVPQLRIGYRGLAKLCRQSGEIKGTPYAHEVCEHDHFSASLGTDKHLEHRPDFEGGDRGAVRLFYAVVKFDDGEVDFEVMTIPQIERIRERSDGWRAFKAGKIKSTPWSTDFDEMAKKTVLRRLLKRLPQSPEVAEALRIEDLDYLPEDAPPRLSVVERLRLSRAKHAPDGFDHGRITAELDGDDAADQTDTDDEEDADDFPGDRQDDLADWADQTLACLPEFATVEELNAFTDDAANIAKFEALMAADPAKARSLEAAINGRRKALAAKEQG